MNTIVPKSVETAKAAADAIANVFDKGGVVIDTNTLLDWSVNDGAQALDRAHTKAHADPEGLHTGHAVLFHNDREFRVRLLIKDKATDVPREVLVDVTPEQWDSARKGTEQSLKALRKVAGKV